MEGQKKNVAYQPGQKAVALKHLEIKLFLRSKTYCVYTEKNNSHFSTKNVVNIINLWLFWYQPQT